MQTTQTVIYKPVGKVVVRRIGEDLLLVPVSGAVARTNCVFPLNRTGEFIWRNISAGMPVAEIARLMAKDFQIDPDTALSDCGQFVQALLEQKLLEAAS